VQERSLTCFTCHAPFLKLEKEHKRQKGRGQTRFYCNRSCRAKTTNSLFPRGNGALNLDAGNRRDAYTPFRWFILRARQRASRYGEMDLTSDYLLWLWSEQEGLCPFTGWKLILPDDANGWGRYSTRNASLDRINSTSGYLRGNVRFVSVMANLARQRFPDVDLIEFCQAVAQQVALLRMPSK